MSRDLQFFTLYSSKYLLARCVEITTPSYFRKILRKTAKNLFSALNYRFKDYSSSMAETFCVPSKLVKSTTQILIKCLLDIFFFFSMFF